MAAFENEKNQVNQRKRQKNSDFISCCLIEINNELFLKSDFSQEKKMPAIYDRITAQELNK